MYSSIRLTLWAGVIMKKLGFGGNGLAQRYPEGASTTPGPSAMGLPQAVHP